MYKDILTGFIIGSSLPVFILFFMGFNNVVEQMNKDNCIYNIFNGNTDVYYLYTIFAPLYLGIMTAFAIFIHKFFKLPIVYSFFIISIISALFVSIFITICNVYEFTPKRLNEQYLYIIIYHIIVYNFIAANIYRVIG